MSSKSDYKNLEPLHGIRSHEIAFLVREYLKANGCHNTVASFLQEFPSANKGQTPVRTINLIEAYQEDDPRFKLREMKNIKF